jgi:hypothetical protein
MYPWCKNTISLFFKIVLYAGSRALERSAARIDTGKDRNTFGRELWLGGAGDTDTDKVFYHQSLCAIQPEVPSENTLGQNEGGRFL